MSFKYAGIEQALKVESHAYRIVNTQWETSSNGRH